MQMYCLAKLYLKWRQISECSLMLSFLTWLGIIDIQITYTYMLLMQHFFMYINNCIKSKSFNLKIYKS